MARGERYFLFNSDAHDDVRFDFPVETINKVIVMWHQGYINEIICKELGLKEVELALIVMDLDYAGRLKQRENGFFGTKSA